MTVARPRRLTTAVVAPATVLPLPRLDPAEQEAAFAPDFAPDLDLDAGTPSVIVPRRLAVLR